MQSRGSGRTDGAAGELRCAVHAGDFGSVGLGKLYRKRACATTGSANQHLVTRLDLSLIPETLQGEYRGLGK